MKQERSVQVYEGKGPPPEQLIWFCRDCRLNYYASGSLRSLEIIRPDKDTMNALWDLIHEMPKRVHMMIHHDGGLYVIKERTVVNVTDCIKDGEQIFGVVLKDES